MIRAILIKLIEHKTQGSSYIEYSRYTNWELYKILIEI